MEDIITRLMKAINNSTDNESKLLFQKAVSTISELIVERDSANRTAFEMGRVAESRLNTIKNLIEHNNELKREIKLFQLEK